MEKFKSIWQDSYKKGQGLHLSITAGIDTSRMTLYWAVRYMAGLPDIQSKVHEEIDRVVGKILKHQSVSLSVCLSVSPCIFYSVIVCRAVCYMTWQPDIQNKVQGGIDNV